MLFIPCTKSRPTIIITPFPEHFLVKLLKKNVKIIIILPQLFPIILLGIQNKFLKKIELFS